MTRLNGKPCVRCGGEEWYADGRTCAACKRRRERERQANLDPAVRGERKRKYRLAHPEKVAAGKKRWYEANKEKMREYHRQRYQERKAAKQAE